MRLVHVRLLPAGVCRVETAVEAPVADQAASYEQAVILVVEWEKNGFN